MIEEAEFLIHPSRIARRIRPSSSLGEPMLPEAIDVAMVNIKHGIPRRLVGIAHPAAIANIIMDHVMRAGFKLTVLRAEMNDIRNGPAAEA
jgi:hypothetical protein